MLIPQSLAYAMLAGLPRLNTGLPMRGIVVEYIRRKGRIDPAVDGRIMRGDGTVKP